MSKTSPRLINLVAELKSVARETDSPVWQDVVQQLEKPRRTYAEVNLGRLERYARENETVVVPGKVLGSGVLTKRLTVSAVDFSETAETKIQQADGEAISLETILEQNPEGTDIRVLR